MLIVEVRIIVSFQANIPFLLLEILSELEIARPRLVQERDRRWLSSLGSTKQGHHHVTTRRIGCVSYRHHGRFHPRSSTTTRCSKWSRQARSQCYPSIRRSLLYWFGSGGGGGDSKVTSTTTTTTTGCLVVATERTRLSVHARYDIGELAILFGFALFCLAGTGRSQLGPSR